MFLKDKSSCLLFNPPINPPTFVNLCTWSVSPSFLYILFEIQFHPRLGTCSFCRYSYKNCASIQSADYDMSIRSNVCTISFASIHHNPPIKSGDTMCCSNMLPGYAKVLCSWCKRIAASPHRFAPSSLHGNTLCSVHMCRGYAQVLFLWCKRISRRRHGCCTRRSMSPTPYTAPVCLSVMYGARG